MPALNDRHRLLQELYRSTRRRWCGVRCATRSGTWWGSLRDRAHRHRLSKPWRRPRSTAAMRSSKSSTANGLSTTARAPIASAAAIASASRLADTTITGGGVAVRWATARMSSGPLIDGSCRSSSIRSGSADAGVQWSPAAPGVPSAVLVRDRVVARHPACAARVVARAAPTACRGIRLASSAVLSMFLISLMFAAGASAELGALNDTCPESTSHATR